MDALRTNIGAVYLRTLRTDATYDVSSGTSLSTRRKSKSPTVDRSMVGRPSGSAPSRRLSRRNFVARSSDATRMTSVLNFVLGSRYQAYGRPIANLPTVWRRRGSWIQQPLP